MTIYLYDYLNTPGADKAALKRGIDNVTGVAQFDTEAAFVAATINTAVNIIKTNGYYAAGDGGGHVKKRITTPSPVYAWHKQSADGSWWQISQTEVKPEYFGAVGDGITADTTAITAANSFAITFSVTLNLSKTYLTTLSPDSVTKNKIGNGSFVYSGRTVSASLSKTYKNHVWGGHFSVSQESGSFTCTTYRRMMLDGMTGARLNFTTGVNVYQDVGTYYPNSCRIQRVSGNAITDSFVGVWNLSRDETASLKNDTAFLSFYSKVGANYSGTNATLKVIGHKASQQPIQLDTGNYDLGTVTLATYTWTPTITIEPYLAPQFLTFAVDSDITQIAFVLTVPYTGTAGTDDWINIEALHCDKGVSFYPMPVMATSQLMPQALTRYRSSFDYGVQPGTVTLTGSQTAIATGTATPNGVVFDVKWDIPMLYRPSVIPYAPVVGGNPRIANESAGTRIFAQVFDVSTTGFWITNNEATVSGNRYRAHWVARAPL